MDASLFRVPMRFLLFAGCCLFVFVVLGPLIGTFIFCLFTSPSSAFSPVFLLFAVFSYALAGALPLGSCLLFWGVCFLAVKFFKLEGLNLLANGVIGFLCGAAAVSLHFFRESSFDVGWLITSALFCGVVSAICGVLVAVFSKKF